VLRARIRLSFSIAATRANQSGAVAPHSKKRVARAWIGAWLAFWSAAHRSKRASPDFWSAVRSTALIRKRPTRTLAPFDPARCLVRGRKRRCRAALQKACGESDGSVRGSRFGVRSVSRRGRLRTFGVRCEAPLWFANVRHERLPHSIPPAASCADESGAVAPHSKKRVARAWIGAWLAFWSAERQSKRASPDFWSVWFANVRRQRLPLDSLDLLSTLRQLPSVSAGGAFLT